MATLDRHRDGETLKTEPPNGDEQGPQLLGVARKNVWREVYQGRWTELPRVQKAEFIVEVVFCLLFCGGFLYLGFLQNVLGFLLVFASIGTVLALFFFLLTRSIR